MARDANRRRVERARGSGSNKTTKSAASPAANRKAERPQPAPSRPPMAERTRPVVSEVTRKSKPAPRELGPAERRQRQRVVWLLSGSTLVALVVVLIGAIIISNRPASACDSRGLACDTVAPNFTLPRVPGGKQVSLSAFRGHPVLLELFATWCPHCRYEAPILEQIGAANKQRGLAVVSVLGDSRDHQNLGNDGPGTVSVADVQWWITAYHVTQTVLYDPQVNSATLSQHAIYKVPGFPLLYLLDSKGIIRWSYSGEISASDLQTQIDKVFTTGS